MSMNKNEKKDVEYFYGTHRAPLCVAMNNDVKWHLKDGRFTDEQMEYLQKLVDEEFGPETYSLTQKRTLIHVTKLRNRYVDPDKAMLRRMRDGYGRENDNDFEDDGSWWEGYPSEDAFWECNGI